MHLFIAVVALLVSSTAFGAAISPDHFRATGNEPGWRLDIGDGELTLMTNLGETKIVAPTPQPEHADGLIFYRVDGDLLLHASDGRVIKARDSERG